jgi:hypothetical protein
VVYLLILQGKVGADVENKIRDIVGEVLGKRTGAAPDTTAKTL